jgi:asparagine synthase (glutamine-hydrolysing)
MCGIAGYLNPAGFATSHGEGDVLLHRMGQAIVHRGPDDIGVWSDADAGVGFVHRRLSIIDLSPAGHQPMVSMSGRYVLIFNGEIYNYQALRADLEKHAGKTAWRGHSDTEVMLSGFDAWGVAPTIQKCIGMFAFALWDRQARALTIGRDRLGEKPLYYGWQGKTFIFGSELKALKAHPEFRASVDRNAVALLMRHNYIPAPHSIYDGIAKLLPGTLLTVSAQLRDAQPIPFWRAARVIADSKARPFDGSCSDAVTALETLLKDAIRQQMVADVPLGAFLSGGVDSSTVVALMQAQSNRPVRTFSIGFDEETYNEAQHAMVVARHLGTDHTEMYVSPQDALSVVPYLPAMYDEPFADSSQIPTHLVSRMARKHVTVSLSGDGGDELFCGYNRYLLGHRIWGQLTRLPVPLRQGAAALLNGLSPSTLNALVRPLQGLLPRRHRFSNLAEKLHKGAAVLGCRTSADVYRGLVSHWDNPGAVVPGSIELPTMLTDGSTRISGLTDIEQMMASDTLTYLPDDILCKVDRAAMSVSLETRVPFLDHRVVEFAWRLPQHLKLRDGVTKWVLRKVLYRYVPKALIERPKMGFGVPIDQWLRGPLRAWAEDLLDEPRLRREGYFDPSLIRRCWAEHQSGRHNWQYRLWDVLSFQSWLEANRHAASAATSDTGARAMPLEPQSLSRGAASTT